MGTCFSFVVGFYSLVDVCYLFLSFIANDLVHGVQNVAAVKLRNALPDTVCVVFSYFYNIHQLTSSFLLSTKDKPNIYSECFFACGDSSYLTRHRKRFHEYHPKSKVGKSRRKKRKVVPHGVETLARSMGSTNVVYTPLPHFYFAEESSTSQQSNPYFQTTPTTHYQSFPPELEGPSNSQNPLSIFPPVNAGSFMTPHHSFFAPATEEYYAQAWSNIDPLLDGSTSSSFFPSGSGMWDYPGYEYPTEVVLNPPREDIPPISGFSSQTGNLFGLVDSTSSSWPLALEQQH